MFKRTLSSFVVFCFFLTNLGQLPMAYADVAGLPAPGTMVALSAPYEPVMIKGLTVHQDNPFLFDFIVDVGQDRASGTALKAEGERLIKYFLASLAIPEKDFWVNLSPYEKDKMIPEALGQTELGRDLLAQDYMLKQITASLIYPEKELGKKFWDRVYAKAQQMYGTAEIPVNTFNKVWIMADRAEVFERNQTAFVVGSHLKVMLEEDYLAQEKNSAKNSVILNPATIKSGMKDLNRINSLKDSSALKSRPQNDTAALGAQIIREIVLPELEREVNTGKNFANLRQIFNSIILSSWYKNNLKEALLNQVYADKSKIKGINLNDPTIKQQIYDQYLKAYKKGVFNYIKEDLNAVQGQAVPKKYFSGGLTPGKAAVNPAMTSNPALLSAALPKDRAMVSFETRFFDSAMKTTPAPVAAVGHPDAKTIAISLYHILKMENEKLAWPTKNGWEKGVSGTTTREVAQCLLGLKEFKKIHPDIRKFIKSESARIIFAYEEGAEQESAQRHQSIKDMLDDKVFEAHPLSEISRTNYSLRFEFGDFQTISVALSWLPLPETENDKQFIIRLNARRITSVEEIRQLIEIMTGLPAHNERLVWKKEREFDEHSKLEQSLRMAESFMPPATPDAAMAAGDFDWAGFLRELNNTQTAFKFSATSNDKMHLSEQNGFYLMLPMVADQKQHIGISYRPQMPLKKADLFAAIIQKLGPAAQTSPLKESLDAIRTQYIDSAMTAHPSMTVENVKERIRLLLAVLSIGEDECNVEYSLRRNGDVRVKIIQEKFSGNVLEKIRDNVHKLKNAFPRGTKFVWLLPDNLDGTYDMRFNVRYKDAKSINPAMTDSPISTTPAPDAAMNASDFDWTGFINELNRAQNDFLFEAQSEAAWAYGGESSIYFVDNQPTTGPRTKIVIRYNPSGNLNRHYLYRLIVQRIKPGESYESPALVGIYEKYINSAMTANAIKADPAVVAQMEPEAAWTQGGIDLATSGMNWTLRKDGQGVEMTIDPAMIERFKREGIGNLSPIIFKITPITSIWPLVGLKEPESQFKLAQG